MPTSDAKRATIPPTATDTTLEVLRTLTTVPVWSDRRPNAAAALGVSRDTAYAMGRDGRLPVLPTGSRKLVSTLVLRRMLGDDV